MSTIIDHETGMIVADDHALVPLSEVETFLAARPPVETAKELRDRLAALCTYYKGKVDVYNELYEGQLRTERYIGEELAKLPRAQGQRVDITSDHRGQKSREETIAVLGLPSTSAYRLEQLASVPEERFNNYIAARKDAAERIVKTDLLAEAFERQIQEAEFKSQQIQVITGSSESNEWYTPVHIIALAREVLGDIDLDPASSPAANAIVQAESYCTPAEDGFNRPWFGRVWLNPPYGREDGEREANAARWARKLITEYEIGQVEAAILLVKAALGYNWFEDLWRRYPTCLLRERLYFTNGETGAGGQAKHATALLYFGLDGARFRSVFRPIGRVILPDEEAT